MENEAADSTADSLTSEVTNSAEKSSGDTEGNNVTITSEPISQLSRERTDSGTGSESGRGAGAGGKDRDKINILLKPVGDAPILKNKLWSVPSERQVSQITEFVKKYLKLEKNQNLFFFVNQLFAPAPDQCLRDLYECFGSDGKLVLHYSTTSVDWKSKDPEEDDLQISRALRNHFWFSRKYSFTQHMSYDSGSVTFSSHLRRESNHNQR
ncbi:Ubiquitin-like protein ATG12, partial [Orchesella cincta]